MSAPKLFAVPLVAALLVVGACDDGAGEPDATLVPTLERKRVFYFRNGTLGKIRDSSDERPGVIVADEACTAEAADGGLGGSWRAWLSSSEVDAVERIDDVGPWYRLDQETLLFPSRAEIGQGPRAAIVPDGEGERRFWSGTGPDGRATAETCSDWTVYNVPAVATIGRADLVGSAWIPDAPLLCAEYLALLCLEQ